MVVSSKWTLPRFVSFLELALLPSKPLLPRCDTFGFFKEPFLGNKGGDLLPLLLLALLCDCEILRVVALNNSRFLLRRVLGETLELLAINNESKLSAKLLRSRLFERVLILRCDGC